MLNLLQSAYSWLQGVEPVPPSEKLALSLVLGSLPVGTLRAENGEWTFEYSSEFRQQDQIKPVVDFPVLDRIYRSPTLWPFFALRIPSPTQAAVRDYLSRHSLETIDEATLLREFGERSISNPFRLVAA